MYSSLKMDNLFATCLLLLLLMGFELICACSDHDINSRESNSRATARSGQMAALSANNTAQHSPWLNGTKVEGEKKVGRAKKRASCGEMAI